MPYSLSSVWKNYLIVGLELILHNQVKKEFWALLGGTIQKGQSTYVYFPCMRVTLLVNTALGGIPGAASPRN